ncbi:hypothetical protein ACFV9E_33930 [Streptomyces sp. NPDC059835]|uniref:hypothetical protein n=1 Tax=Streptomyces sp. NPDC059835 TaxID=3346967 RepID=UPI0036602005
MNRGAVVDTYSPNDSPGSTLTLSANPSTARSGPALVTGQSALPGRAFSAFTSKPCGAVGEDFPPGVPDASCRSSPFSAALPSAPAQPDAAAPSPATVAAPVAIARNRRLPAPLPLPLAPAMCS